MKLDKIILDFFYGRGIYSQGSRALCETFTDNDKGAHNYRRLVPEDTLKKIRSLDDENTQERIELVKIINWGICESAEFAAMNGITEKIDAAKACQVYLRCVEDFFKLGGPQLIHLKPVLLQVVTEDKTHLLYSDRGGFLPPPNYVQKLTDILRAPPHDPKKESSCVIS